MFTSAIQFLSSIEFSATDAITPNFRNQQAQQTASKVFNFFINVAKTLLWCTIIVPAITLTYDLAKRKPHVVNPQSLNPNLKQCAIVAASFVSGSITTLLATKSLGSFSGGIAAGVVGTVLVGAGVLYGLYLLNQRDSAAQAVHVEVPVEERDR